MPVSAPIPVLFWCRSVSILKWTVFGHGFGCFNEENQIIAFLFVGPSRYDVKRERIQDTSAAQVFVSFLIVS